MLVAFGQDKVWDEATLTTFLRDPQGVVEGTRMPFFGLKKDEEIKAVPAFLATFDPDGMAPQLQLQSFSCRWNRRYALGGGYSRLIRPVIVYYRVQLL